MSAETKSKPSRWSRVQRILRTGGYDLDNKVVLVTGGARGLGLELARAFAEAHAKVAIAARTQLDLDAAVDELRSIAARVTRRHSAGGSDARVVGIVCDVTEEGASAKLVAEVVATFGKLDVLVNNAGVILVGPESEMTRADFEREMETHFWAPLDMMRAALPHMRKSGGGRIVNISSVGGKIAVPHLLPYSATKFALTGLSTGLHSELAHEGIVVTTVHPGLMRTGSPMNASFKGRHPQEYAWFAISDALPIVSMNAARAAKQIVTAMKDGKAEITLSLPAKVGVVVRSLLPNVTAKVLSLVNELLPAAENGRSQARFGFESESPLAPSILTELSRDPETRNNENVHRRAVEAGQGSR